MINVRKLAALDLALHGSKLILAEFSVGVLLPLCLGVFSLLRSHEGWKSALGWYLILVSINYVPLTIYAIAIMLSGKPQDEVADVLSSGKKLGAKYAAQSLLLLVPLIVPAFAIVQELEARK